MNEYWLSCISQWVLLLFTFAWFKEEEGEKKEEEKKPDHEEEPGLWEETYKSFHDPKPNGI